MASSIIHLAITSELEKTNEIKKDKWKITIIGYERKKKEKN